MNESRSSCAVPARGATEVKRPWTVALLAISMATAGEAESASWQPVRIIGAGWEVAGQAELLVMEVLAEDDQTPFGLDPSLAADSRIDFRANVAATFDAPDNNGDRLPDDGDYAASLGLFRLRIGDTAWDEGQPANDVVIRVRGGVVIGAAFRITETLPAHPDLIFDLPASPGPWAAIDERDGVLVGTVTGIYQLPQVLFRDGFEAAP